jgi:hypothetical protein
LTLYGVRSRLFIMVQQQMSEFMGRIESPGCPVPSFRRKHYYGTGWKVTGEGKDSPSVSWQSCANDPTGFKEANHIRQWTCAKVQFAPGTLCCLLGHRRGIIRPHAQINRKLKPR